MTIGTGIAIAGVWILAGMVSVSRTTSGLAMALSMWAALMVTLWLM